MKKLDVAKLREAFEGAVPAYRRRRGRDDARPTRSTSTPSPAPGGSSTLASTSWIATGARCSRAPREETAFLRSHSWDEYAEWHLGLTEGAGDETKARHAFVFGDFRRVHRSGLIACVYRASEWRHKEVELAAHDLLQHLDSTSALSRIDRAGESVAAEWGKEALLALEGEEEQVHHAERVAVRAKRWAPGRVAHDRRVAALHGAMKRLGDDARTDAGQLAAVELRLAEDVEEQRRVIQDGRSLRLGRDRRARPRCRRP